MKVMMEILNKGLAEANYLVTREEGYTKKDLEYEMNISVKTYGDAETWSKWFNEHVEKIRNKGTKNE